MGLWSLWNGRWARWRRRCMCREGKGEGGRREGREIAYKMCYDRFAYINKPVQLSNRKGGLELLLNFPTDFPLRSPPASFKYFTQYFTSHLDTRQHTTSLQSHLHTPTLHFPLTIPHSYTHQCTSEQPIHVTATESDSKQPLHNHKHNTQSPTRVKYTVAHSIDPRSGI